MKLPKSLRNVGKLTQLDERFRETLDSVVETIIDIISSGSDFDTRNHTILERGLFYKAIGEWCRRHPETPARMLTIRPWDESSDNNESFNFPEAIRREIIPVIENQFDESVLFTQLDSQVFALFLTNDHGSLVSNEFDWESKLQGLETCLSKTVPLSFHFESARWPRDASTVQSLIDAASPPDTDITEIPSPESERTELEQKLDSVLKVDLRRQVEEKLPQAISEKLPLRRFMN